MEENEIVEKHDSFLEKHPDGKISKKSFDQLLSECFTKSSRKKLRSQFRIKPLRHTNVQPPPCYPLSLSSYQRQAGPG